MESLQPWLPHLAGVAGIIIGSLTTWFLCRSKAQAMRARHEERSKAARKSLADLEAGCANLEAEVRQLRHSEAVSLKRQSELEILAQTQLRGLAEKQQLLKEAEHRIAQNIKALSQEALRDTQREFLELARSSFDEQQKEATSELEQRRIAVETLVRPVAATLTKVENRIGDLERARQETESSLGEHVRQMATAQAGLQRETAQLARALRQPSGRGRWGEIQLKRVVELAGMQSYCDFYAPTDKEIEAHPQRPNLVVNLPAGRLIAIDAHAPLDAYLSAVEATEEGARLRDLRHHAELIASHLNHLASASYRSQFMRPPEFTVLFLPSESFLSAALGEKPDLLESGLERGVILATPSTLIALLRSAAVGWRQEGIAEQARSISDAGRELYTHVSSLAEQISRVGKSLDATVHEYNATVGSLERTVLPGARKFNDLGVPAHPAELPSAMEIGQTVKQAQPDLSRLPASPHAEAAATLREAQGDSFEGFAAPAPGPEEAEPGGAAGDFRAAV